MMIALPKMTEASVLGSNGSVDFLDLSLNLHSAADAGLLGIS